MLYQIDKKRLNCQSPFTFQTYKGKTTNGKKSYRLHYFGRTEEQYHCFFSSFAHSFSCV